MDSLIKQLHTVATEANDADRHLVLDAIRSLLLRLETPHDTLTRFSALRLEITVARIGADLGIFKILVDSEQPLDIATLSTRTNAAPVLLGRLLRYCASVGLVHETAPGIFAANATTKTLAQPAYEGGIRHYFDSVGPTLQVLPSFLAETKYQDIVNPTDTAFQRAFATDLPALKWLPTQPDLFKAFQQTMTVRGAPGAPWFSVFPFEQELGNFAGAHAFIDVGGGFGHQCLSLRAAFPSLENKIVLQDLPETLKQTSFDLKGILPMAHDFFQPQPLEGARFYYMRNILHDWPDEKCASILRNLASAFGPESQILIDDMVLPDSGAPWEATSLDIKMMALFGARERTTAEWLAVIDAAGLKVSRIVSYSTLCQDSIIQVVAK